MTVTPAKTFRLNLSDQIMLAELARYMQISQAEVIRLLIRKEANEFISKKTKIPSTEKINEYQS